MPFKDVFYLSYGSHCFQQSKTICASLVEGIMGNIPDKLFQFPAGVV